MSVEMKGMVSFFGYRGAVRAGIGVFVASGGFLMAEKIGEGVVFFESKVRPILVEHCYRCHSEEEGKRKGGLLLDRKAGWMEGGDSGESVLNLKEPSESLLIKMVHHDPDFEAMPPKSKLSEKEIGDLVKWVEMGAPDPRGEAIGESVAKEAFDLEERSKWWSLQPLMEVKVPEVEGKGWPLNEVDRFLKVKLEEKGWEPAGEARKEDLLRRLSVTLTGLAPTAEEVLEYLEDEEEGAYERQVDRLMGSVHFGERFARHWMDVVRFADSKAFESDYTIPYTAEYRDYLIRSFNADVPFDQFVKEAFAGDLLAEPRVVNGVNESVMGPGFMLFTDGQHGPPDIHEDEARVFDGMINTATVAFQGLTVSCAKCHDHKFDAITTADYYSFYGMLRSSRLHYANAQVIPEHDASVVAEIQAIEDEVLKGSLGKMDFLREAVEVATATVADPEWAERIAQVGKAKDREKAMADLRTEFRESGANWLAEEWFQFLVMDRPAMELAGLRRALLGQRVKKAGLMVDQGKKFEWVAKGEGFERVDEEVLLWDAVETARIRGGAGPGYVSGRVSGKLDGTLRSGDFVLDGKPVELWVKGQGAVVNLIVRNYELVGYGPTTNVLRKVVNSDSPVKLTFPTTLWEGETAYLEVLQHGEVMQCYRAKEDLPRINERAYAVVPDRVDSGRWDVDWGGDVSIVLARLKELLEAGEKRELIGALAAEGLLPQADTDSESGRSLVALHGSLPKPRYVRTLTDGPGMEQRVYVRGNHKSESKEANPKRFMDAFGGTHFEEKGSGRLEYAEHLLTTGQALTARVRVNRIWSRIFGQGLVSSVDDFGKMGTAPSHPELLDYLAGEFVKNGWSTKWLIRKLVTTRAFQMSSKRGSEVMEADPGNIFLQHMPLQRMDAESVRDHLLAVSGNLKEDVFGPAVGPWVGDLPGSRASPRNGPLDGAGRRSIYQQMRRNFLPSFQRAFNLPLPVAPVGQRQVTNVPAQALALLNHPLVIQQAEGWAKRLEASSDDVEERIRLMHLQGFSREATEREVRWAKGALEEFLKEEDQAKAWVSLCHVMMNRKEFIYVF